MWNDAQSRAFTVMWNDTQRGDAQSRAFTTMWNGAEVQTAHMLTQRGDLQRGLHNNVVRCTVAVR